MSDFEEYIKVNYPRDYERQKRIYPDQSVEELYSEDYKMWQHQQATINDLKAQLECCRRENVVLLGKVGELQERIDGAIRDLTRPCYTQAGKIDDALKTLRGKHD